VSELLENGGVFELPEIEWDFRSFECSRDRAEEAAAMFVGLLEPACLAGTVNSGGVTLFPARYSPLSTHSYQGRGYAPW